MSALNLKDIYNSFLKELTAGVKNRDHGMHIIQFGTISSSGPEIRSVVLRRVHFDPLKIFFHTHADSPKIKELLVDPRSSIHAYDKTQKKQLRFSGVSTLVTSGSIYEEQTRKMTASASRCYLSPYAPSTLLNDYHPNLPDIYMNKAPTQDEKLSQYPKMTLIEFAPHTLDALWLRAEGHVRLKANFREKEVSLSWLAP